MMTERLRQAVERAASVFEAQEQDALADQLLAKLAKEENHLTEFVHGIVDTLAQLMDADDDAKWLALFAEDWDKFERLAEKARAETQQAWRPPSTPISSEIAHPTVFPNRLPPIAGWRPSRRRSRFGPKKKAS